MAALIFILISLTAAVFHGVAPVRAEDVTTPAPIVIDENTATVDVKLYTDEYRTQELKGAVTSTSKLYGAFSANFKTGKAPSTGSNVAVYKFPDTIAVDDNDGGVLTAGTGDNVVNAGTWKIKDNKVFFTFDKAWLANNPADIYVAANFSFQLKNKDVGSGGVTPVAFPGKWEVDISTKDGNVTGDKSGAFSQDADGTAKVTWTVKLTVESYATDVKITDTLGENFEFVKDSFMLDGEKLNPQPTIDDQVATIEKLGDLSRGDHTITYETKLKSGISVDNGEFINGQEASKNTAKWEWGGADDRSYGNISAVSSPFRYDMISKSSDRNSTLSDITWTVTLNQGELKADMSGYVFTDTLDSKQAYTAGSYTVYKGSSGSEVLETGTFDPKQGSFTYTFPPVLDDKYITYRIVYHTKMIDANSYDTVRNNATIEHEGRVSGAAEGKFTPQLVGTPIFKRLVSSDEAATTGRATWETRVALNAIVNAVHPDRVTVKDTFQSAWSQNLDVDVDSITITIGKTQLVRGENDDWNLTANWPVGGTKRNFNLDIYVNDKVKAALENNDYAVITYTTTSGALSGWYSNFASVNVNGTQYYTTPAQYFLNQEATPSVDKPSTKTSYVWKEQFNWKDVDGTDEKGAWIVDWTVYANRQQGNKGANGEYEYYGAGKLNSSPLNIVDTLPGGMSYVSGSAKYTLVQNPYDQHAGYGRGNETKTVVSDRELASDNVKSAGNTVTFSIPTTDLGEYAGFARLTYQTAVKRGKLDASTNVVKFTNSASAESGEKEFSSGSGTVTIKNNVIKKTGEQVASSNRIKYTILVNESAVDLKSGTDVLELVDTMDAKCTLVPSTLKVYGRVDNDWSELTDKDYSSEMEQIDDKSGSHTKLTLNVPDGKYLKVEYEVIPSGDPGDEVSLSNTAELTGVTEGTAIDKQTWKIKDASASAGGNGYSITMTKYDAQQVGATLEGAEFKLYSVDMGQVKNLEEVESVRKLPGNATTGVNGKISFGTSDKKMGNCVLYQLVETKAPAGYAVVQQPVWIMLRGSASDGDYKAALTKAKTIVGEADIIGDDKKDEIWVYDNRLTGSAVIKAKKVLEGGTFKEGQFSFELKDGNGKVLKTVANDADGNITFDVKYTKAGTYTYTISEVEPEGAVGHVKDHITYDRTAYNVTVNVTNGNEQLDTAVTYANGSETPPTFTNKYSTTLPEAGGAGLTMTYLAGASMLCFAATWMHACRHRDLDRGGRHE